MYFFTGIFGFGSGSIISLAPVCFGQLCKANDYGRYYGTAYSVVSFACVALHLSLALQLVANEDARTLISIPVGGAFGPNVLPVVFGGIVAGAFMCFIMARWACLEYHWTWFVKI